MIKFTVVSTKGELLRARLDAHGKAVVELFCLLVENSPEVLPPEWAAVADVIPAEEWPLLLEHARWVYECQRSGARHGYQS